MISAKKTKASAKIRHKQEMLILFLPLNRRLSNMVTQIGDTLTKCLQPNSQQNDTDVAFS